MSSSWQDLEKQLGQLTDGGVPDLQFAQAGIKVSTEQVAVLQEFFAQNEQLIGLLRQLATQPKTKVDLGLSHISAQELQSILQAIKEDPKEFAQVLHKFSEDPSLYQKFLEAAQTKNVNDA